MKFREWLLIAIAVVLASTVALPQYLRVAQLQDNAAKEQLSGRVKSALVLALADVKTFPSVARLALYVQAEAAQADAAGITLAVDGRTYSVPTFSDKDCSVPTASLDAPVLCVGNIP